MTGLIAQARNERYADRDLAILELLMQGMMQRDIAARLGFSRSTVGLVARRHNLQRRPRFIIPSWVPEHLHEDYRLIAEEDGEENAASYCRRAKRDAVLSYGPIEHGVR